MIYRCGACDHEMWMTSNTAQYSQSSVQQPHAEQQQQQQQPQPAKKEEDGSGS